MLKYKILVADDEKQMLLLLRSYLENLNFEIFTANDGNEVLKLWKQQSFDLIVLDIMMPKIDGFTVCKKIRQVSNVPIIMLTAKSEELDRVHGLKIGADDYIVKPFSPKELVARIEALLRRAISYNQRQDMITIKDLVVDTVGHRVTVKGKTINLTRKEFNLLNFLIQHKRQVFAREQLLDQIWGLESTATLRTVDTHIKTLRLKLDTASDFIKTVWGVGYKFEP